MPSHDDRSRPLVDYDTNAQRCRRGRDLTTAQLERRRAAVADRMPDGPPSIVVDALLIALRTGTLAGLELWPFDAD